MRTADFKHGAFIRTLALKRAVVSSFSGGLLPPRLSAAQLTSAFTFTYVQNVYSSVKSKINSRMWACVRQIVSQAHNRWLIIISLNPNFQVTRRPLTTQSHKLCWSCWLQNRKWISVWAPNRISRLPRQRNVTLRRQKVFRNKSPLKCVKSWRKMKPSVILIGLCHINLAGR